MEYTVVVEKAGAGWKGTGFAKSADALSEQVRAHLAKGWHPQGGVCFARSPGSSRPYLLQALVREGRRGQ